jgi:hypothetical protein
MLESMQKNLMALNKAFKHLQPDLVMFVPKLIDFSKHSLATYVLLEHLQKPDAKPTCIYMYVCLNFESCSHKAM